MSLAEVPSKKRKATNAVCLQHDLCAMIEQMKQDPQLPLNRSFGVLRSQIAEMQTENECGNAKSIREQAIKVGAALCSTLHELY